jgi:hypothetical protein
LPTSHLYFTAATRPPGRSRWTLALLAEHLRLLEGTDPISLEAVHQRLKKARSSPGS